MKPECSIIVRAYNEEKYIGKLFAGIREQTLKNIQVILVDSGSTDRTVDIAKECGVQVVHIDPQTFTFGHSLNFGISHAESEILVLASAHVYPVYPDWLEKLIAPFKDESVAVCYGKQSGAFNSQFSEKQIFQHWYPETSQHKQGTPFCNNANAAIRKSLWEQHPYDEKLPALEDLAWAKWASENGYTVSYSAEAEVIHIHHEPWKSVYNRYRREGMAFKQIYPNAHFTLGDLIRLLFANISSDYLAARAQKVFLKEWHHIIKFRWSQFWGTYQGYRQSARLLTWNLKRTFYYPNTSFQEKTQLKHRIDPIQYKEESEKR